MASASRVLIGRAREQEELGRFLGGIGADFSACVLEGEPGIGKTSLWGWAVADARARSVDVLALAATRAEASLAYAGVDALLGGIGEDVLEALPPPQRRALAVALLKEDAGLHPPDQRLIAAAFLNTLRALAAERPVLVAVDDVHWLDDASAVVLAYALRRLSSEPVGLLVAHRRTSSERLPDAFSAALPPDRTMEMTVSSLTRDGVRWLLAEHLGAELPQPSLRRVWETSGGNPLFALELGRALLAAGVEPAPGQPLPVPQTLDELVQARVRSVPPRAREVLLTAAAAAAPTPELLAAASSSSPETVANALEAAAQAGLVSPSEDQVRFVHPLFAEALLAAEPAAGRRRLHQRLAAVVSDLEQRARHAALAATRPDEAVAELLEEAARSAAARGAPQSAAELAALAAGLTAPQASADAHRRRCLSADCLYRAGEYSRARKILQEELERAPAGLGRADVLIALGAMHWDDFPRAIELLEQGLREAGDDPRRASLARLRLADLRTLAGDSAHEALATLRPAIETAEQAGDQELLVRVLSLVALLESYSGSVTPGVLERALELERAGVTVPGDGGPSSELGRRLKFQDRYEEARRVLADAVERAAGDEPARYQLLTNIAELECRAGDFAAAEQWAVLALELAEQVGIEEQGGPALYCAALVDAHLGRVESARAAAGRGIAICARVGDSVFDIYNRAVLGFLELSLDDPVAADRWLRPLVARHERLGSDEPSHLRFRPDAIEALVGIGERRLAGQHLERFEQLVRATPSPWGEAAAARCRGILGAAEGDLEGALAAFEAALARHGRTSAFERGRTLLALGQAQRRVKRKRPARESLEQALAVFEESRTPLWAGRARSELERIGGRAPASGELTPTERRVAELVAQGRSNKQVAAALFVSVHTVESNLSRIYRKLGVSSRTELAHRLPPA